MITRNFMKLPSINCDQQKFAARKQLLACKQLVEERRRRGLMMDAIPSRTGEELKPSRKDEEEELKPSSSNSPATKKTKMSKVQQSSCLDHHQPECSI